MYYTKEIKTANFKKGVTPGLQRKSWNFLPVKSNKIRQ